MKFDLGALDVVAAVVRNGSLTRAAAALGMSQPAVSYQLRKIEDGLKCTLFDRSSDGCTLTQAGTILWRALDPALAEIEAAVDEIGALGGARALRIVTDFAFAGFWLMPRLGEFRLSQPDLQVQIVATQSPGMPRKDEVAIRFGTAAAMPATARLLMPERVMPVCAPGHPAAVNGPQGATLIHLEAHEGAQWMTWGKWFAATGQTYRAGPGDIRLNTYDFVIQAAVHGQGVALGWLPLIASQMAEGTLVPAGKAVDLGDRGYWLVEGPGQSVQDFAGWLSKVLRRSDDASLAGPRSGNSAAMGGK
ncbi:LysR substrate-binding domain-containing protein [Defluviimonas sp. WL0002]|uniref:LysR substrate-binding domain-containing protein n=1 Tax=Albidovulum marisflavi TaxID=2984159 RepID=A0ABT2ZHD2_9RHOB|nr:LysR substrate-binding domain-containing protein [Defluviimonas sp. WL0002]MCV2870548.1 LysR substrate-binding domain-containing protein [Defluviimonas sp. WL0002]